MLQETTTQASELFDYLKTEYTTIVFDDLELCEPNEEDNEGTKFSGREHLKNQDFVCCEQKLIWWDKDGYIIACLYNSHPNVKYPIKEDVLDFLMGNNRSVEGCQFLDYPKENERYSGCDTSKAYNDGLFCHFYEQMNGGLKEFSKNAFVIGGLGENNIIFGATKVLENGEWVEQTINSNEDLINLKID
jgi:hypothetical protein